MKKLKKKDYSISHFKNLIKSTSFLSFILLQNLTVKDKLLIKEELFKSNLRFKVIKNTLLREGIKKVFKFSQDLTFLSQGTVIMVYPINLESDISFEDLKTFFKFTEKNANMLLLGGLHNFKFYNKFYLSEINKLADFSTTIFGIMSTLKVGPNKLLHNVSQSSFQILHNLKNIKG